MTKPKTPAHRRVPARRWIALSTVAAAGIATGAPAPAAPAADSTAKVSAEADALDAYVQLVASTKKMEGGEGGEGVEGGEGGEGGAASAGEAGYLAELGFVDGHLRAGASLYEAGQAEMAKTHMKHPEDEIYADLAPKLEAHGAGQFDAELTALAEAVESGAPAEDVKAALADVMAAIEAARGTAGGGEAERLEAIVLMTRTAAEEYDVAVENGMIVNLHEYQDAWGFIEAARDMVARLANSSDAKVKEALGKIEQQLAVIAPAFDGGLVPGDGARLEDPSLLYGAAARMELAAIAAK